jgi:hypothetical protein
VGDLQSTVVQQGNAITDAAAALFKLAHIRGCCCVLENPVRSVMFQYGSLVDCLAGIPLHYAVCPHCKFSTAPVGQRFSKKFKFMCNGPWVGQLRAVCDCQAGHLTLVRTRKAGGRRKVWGIPKLLLESAAYPPKLGEAIIQAWQSKKSARQENTGSSIRRSKVAKKSSARSQVPPVWVQGRGRSGQGINSAAGEVQSEVQSKVQCEVQGEVQEVCNNH